MNTRKSKLKAKGKKMEIFEPKKEEMTWKGKNKNR